MKNKIVPRNQIVTVKIDAFDSPLVHINGPKAQNGNIKTHNNYPNTTYIEVEEF